jgi:GNAT superfamily N-acetyltransferase
MSVHKSNFERMLQLAEDIFAVKNDPDQLDVNENVIAHLQRIHPATVSEYDNGEGPVAWVLLIPTTTSLMNMFLQGDITEKQLYEQTPLDSSYDAVYLCSAMVLEEHRRQGITKRLVLDAIRRIRQDHPLKALFVWSFTKEGDQAAEMLALETQLPLFRKP